MRHRHCRHFLFPLAANCRAIRPVRCYRNSFGFDFFSSFTEGGRTFRLPCFNFNPALSNLALGGIGGTTPPPPLSFLHEKEMFSTICLCGFNHKKVRAAYFRIVHIRYHIIEIIEGEFRSDAAFHSRSFSMNLHQSDSNF